MSASTGSSGPARSARSASKGAMLLWLGVLLSFFSAFAIPVIGVAVPSAVAVWAFLAWRRGSPGAPLAAFIISVMLALCSLAISVFLLPVSQEITGSGQRIEGSP
jgi:ABC-type Fe3+ transport system permease subunit